MASASPERRPTPRALGATVSDDVEAVFAKALAVKPAERWPSGGDFWNALRHSLRMDPIRGMTDPAPQRAFADPVSMAPTVAASSEPKVALEASATSPRLATTTTGRRPGSAKMGLFVALGLGAVGAIAATVVLLGKGRQGAAPVPSAVAVLSPAPSSSALAAVLAACPSGMIRIPGGSFYMGSDEGLPMESPPTR